MTENMKDSGIEWIGEIPEEWDISKLKDLFTFGKGLSITKENLVDEGISVISYGQIHSKNNNGVKISESLIRYVDKKYLLKNFDSLVHQSDFIFADTSEDLDGCGNCIYVNSEMILFAGYHTIILNAINAKDNRYLAYLFKTDVWRSQIRSKVYGIKVYSITQKILKEANIIIPPFFEQQAIADFLDEKVGQVDDILADLNRQIEILNQYRDSVIYEATSKGLNKNNVYQNIDNEWYPQIPAHWRFMAVKRLTSVLTCGVASTPEYVDEDNGVLFLSAQNIQNNKLDLSIKKYIPFSLHKTLTKNRKPEKGDILQVRVGATIGKCAIVDIDEEFSVYVSLSHIRVNDHMHNRFLNYIIGTDMFKEMVSLDIDYAGTQGNLNVADLREVRIPVPPIQEQKEIADYLDKKCSQIDSLMEDKKKQIEKIENYKKSLIYEYVTGKKRVKGV